MVKGRKKFWDDDNQRSKAGRYARRNGLDFKNEEVKKALRSMYRTKEGRTNVLTPEINHTYKKNPETGEYETIVEKTGSDNPNTNKTVKKAIKAVIPSEYPDEIPDDPNERPPPTGFISPLPFEEWVVKYLPRVFGKGLYKVQEEIVNHFKQYSWSMIKVFRSAGKTMIGLARKLYNLCQNPNERIFILGEEYKKTVQRVRLLRNWLGTPEIIADYGYLVNDGTNNSKRKGKNTEGMFDCFRSHDAIEPSVIAITWKDSVSLGMHFTDGLMDDPWSNKLQTTEGALDKWMEWWGEFQGSLEKCKELLILCTRKGIKDLYFRLSLEKQFKDLTIPLVKWARWEKCKLIRNEEDDLFLGAEWENGEGIDYELTDDCFGKYSMSVLNRDIKKGPIQFCIPIFRKTKQLKFEMEYQQNPYLPEGNIFKWKNVNLYDGYSMDIIVKNFYKQFSSIKKIAIMDAAFGETESSDYNVLYVMAYYRGRYFIVDSWMGHWSDKQRIDAINSMDRKYPSTPLYIESDYAQIKIFKDIKRNLPSLKIKEFKSKGKGQDYKVLYLGEKKAAKKGKIHSALSLPLNDGKLYVPKNLLGIDELQDQTITFPKCRFFDCLDVAAMGVLILGQSTGATAIKANRIRQSISF